MKLLLIELTRAVSKRSLIWVVSGAPLGDHVWKALALGTIPAVMWRSLHPRPQPTSTIASETADHNSSIAIRLGIYLGHQIIQCFLEIINSGPHVVDTGCEANAISHADLLAAPRRWRTKQVKENSTHQQSCRSSLEICLAARGCLV